MDDNILTTVLLVIVSILLIVDIVVALTVLMLVRKIKTITERVDGIASNLETASGFVAQASLPVLIGKIAKIVTKQVNKSK